MIARLPLLSVAVFFLVGCSESTPPPQESPPDQSAPTFVGSSVSSELEDNSESNCSGDEIIRELRTEYVANPLRAGQRYGGERICVEGKITEFYQLRERILKVELSTEDGTEFDLTKFHPGWDRRMAGNVRKSYEEDEGKAWDDWKEWVMSSSAGDIVEAECRITGLGSVDKNSRPTPEVPVLEDCVKR